MDNLGQLLTLKGNHRINATMPTQAPEAQQPSGRFCFWGLMNTERRVTRVQLLSTAALVLAVAVLALLK
jgi:hypothetical protein